MPRQTALNLVLALAFAFLTALAARIEVPMAPVPMTMQTFAVLLAGVVLGPVGGGVAILGYLALAAAGLPILSDGASGLAPFTGATAGYLFAFPVAAVLAGWLSRRGTLRPIGEGTSWLFALHLLILAVGTGWLATKIGAREAFYAGFTPFLAGAIVKSVLVWLAAWAIWRMIERKTQAPGSNPRPGR